jgi:hypothetical protein
MSDGGLIGPERLLEIQNYNQQSHIAKRAPTTDVA